MTTKNSSLHIQEFMDYFSGSQYYYGEAIYTDEIVNNKRVAKCQTISQKLLTIEEYKSHLKGEKGLGIIPINQDNKCKFGVIDIDIYNEDLSMYIEAIERKGFPLVPFKSKSGGLHLYMFLKDYESASKVVQLLKQMAFYLSIESLVKSKKNEMVEIFPKQTKLTIGQAGNWINLPYYDSENTNSGLILKGKVLSLTDALVHIKKRRTTVDTVTQFLNELEYQDAPPCLQLINILNFTEANSGRNNYLFSFGVYFKTKDEDFFEQQLLEINNGMKVPLEEKEVRDTIIKSLQKKDYVYKCTSSPCIDFCNKKVCQKREFGIGKNEGYFSSVECGQLIQYKTAQPYYEWEVRSQGSKNFKPIRFKSEDEIIKQDAFLRLCMRELHELPSKLKQTEWFKKVNQHLKELKVIEVEEEDDTSPQIMLKNLIIEFLTGRAMADNVEQILHKRVYFDPAADEYLFRVKDLNDYVYIQKQFKYFTPQELHGILRELKCVDKKAWLKDKKTQIRVKVMQRSMIDTLEYTETFKADFSAYSEQQF